MRDVHYDDAFARDFNAASKSWSWATWHQVRAEQEAVAERLLRQMFGAESEQVPGVMDEEGDPTT